MEDKRVHGLIRLGSGGKTIEVDALFDTGASRSVLSSDIAEQLKSGYVRLPADQEYSLGTASRDGKVRVTGRLSVTVELPDCEIPSTPFEVSEDLEPGKLIIGRTQLDEWGIEFTKDGPHPRTCPVRLEII